MSGAAGCRGWGLRIYTVVEFSKQIHQSNSVLRTRYAAVLGGLYGTIILPSGTDAKPANDEKRV